MTKLLSIFMCHSKRRALLMLLHSTKKIFTFKLDAPTLRGLYVCEINKYVTIYV